MNEVSILFHVYTAAISPTSSLTSSVRCHLYTTPIPSPPLCRHPYSNSDTTHIPTPIHLACSCFQARLFNVEFPARLVLYLQCCTPTFKTNFFYSLTNCLEQHSKHMRSLPSLASTTRDMLPPGHTAHNALYASLTTQRRTAQCTRGTVR